MHQRLAIKQFVERYILPFERPGYIYDPRAGFIVWRRGTGNNVELLHIRTFEKGKGHGRRLVYQMLDKLADDPPYHSVFGFTRVDNAEAKAFYGALGFELQTVRGLYADGQAIMFWQSYARLQELRTQYEGGLHRQA